jgi:hypothetical protein
MNDRSSPNARSSWDHEPTVLPGKIFLFTFINLKTKSLTVLVKYTPLISQGPTSTSVTAETPPKAGAYRGATFTLT